MPTEIVEDPYLCRKQAARYLGGFSPATLAVAASIFMLLYQDAVEN